MLLLRLALAALLSAMIQATYLLVRLKDAIDENMDSVDETQYDGQGKEIAVARDALGRGCNFCGCGCLASCQGIGSRCGVLKRCDINGECTCIIS